MFVFFHLASLSVVYNAINAKAQSYICKSENMMQQNTIHIGLTSLVLCVFKICLVIVIFIAFCLSQLDKYSFSLTHTEYEDFGFLKFVKSICKSTKQFFFQCNSKALEIYKKGLLPGCHL